MARSEALKRAQEKYNQKTTNYHLRLNNEKDEDIVTWTKAISDSGATVQDYIKNLIRDDIERRMNMNRTVTFTDEQALATIHALQTEIKETEAAMAEDTAPNDHEAMEKQFNHCKYLASIVSMISSAETVD